MTPQELKNSILQLAIQGKLVEQRPEEGTAEELFAQIQEEKQRLIAEKKIKKEKPLPEITEDEKPFEIPESWKWVRVGEVFSHNTGKAMNSTAKNGNKAGAIRKFITTSNLYWNSFDLSSVKEMFFSDDELERYTVTKGDLLMCEGGAYYGRTAIWCYNYDICFQNHVHRLRPYKAVELLFFYHLFYFYKSMNMMKAKGTAMPGLSSQTLHQMVIPFPPLAEQKRIVAKIEVLLPYIDRYEQTWSKLEQFNSRFPEDMKKSLLQYAIQGKLVEQRPEEGTAEELFAQIQQEKQRLIAEKKIKKEKPLPEITEDEKPFDIPESWKWVRLDDIAYQIGDIDHKMPPTVQSDGVPYISPLNFTKDGGIDFEGAKQISMEDFLNLSKKCTPERNDIIFPRYGTIGVIRMVNTDRKFLVSYSCCTIKNMGHFMYPKYVFYVLQTKLIKDEINRYINKTTQPNVGLKSIKMFLFPLPPLAEQKRIVEKLEQLLPLCERLK